MVSVEQQEYLWRSRVNEELQVVKEDPAHNFPDRAVARLIF